MPAPSSTLPLSLALAGWWLPVLGLLLAGLGAALVAVALGDLVAPVRATRSIAGATVAVESIVGHAVLTAPVGRGIGAGAGAGAMVHLVPGQRERPANCLGADLATGRRPESAHLATVPLQRPADCGDARDAITALATLRHASRTTDADSSVLPTPLTRIRSRPPISWRPRSTVLPTDSRRPPRRRSWRRECPMVVEIGPATTWRKPRPPASWCPNWDNSWSW